MKKIILRIKLFKAKSRLREFKFVYRFYKGTDNEQTFDSCYNEQLVKIETIENELKKLK